MVGAGARLLACQSVSQLNTKLNLNWEELLLILARGKAACEVGSCGSSSRIAMTR